MTRTRLVILVAIACLVVASCGSEPEEPAGGDQAAEEEEGYPDQVVSDFLAGCTDGQSRKYCECVIEKMQENIPFSEAEEAMGSGDQQAIAAFFEEHRAEIVEPCLKFAT